MGLFNPVVFVVAFVLLGGLLALAVLAARRMPGSDEAIVVCGVAALLLGFLAATAWRSDGATTWTAALAVAAAAAAALFGYVVYRRVGAPQDPPAR